MQYERTIKINIRVANPTEADLLSQIAFESKSYWKYDTEYLNAARVHLRVSEEDIQRDKVIIIEEDNTIKGFYHFKSVEKAELIWLFIRPEFIGKGIGKLLWKHLLKTIKEMGINQFIIKSDPNAEDFYLRLGATRIGQSKSTVNEYIELPLLMYQQTTLTTQLHRGRT